MFSAIETLYMCSFILSIYIGMMMVLSRIKRILQYGSSFETRFSIEKSDKIFSYTEEAVEDGILIVSLISLWRERRTKDFFVLITAENKKNQQYSYLESWKARELINKKAPSNIKSQLILDWINCNDRSL